MYLLGVVSKALQWKCIAHWCAVFYMLLLDGQGQPLTYLNCTCTWGSWLYFRLHYKLLPAMFQSEHVQLMNNMFVYLISHHTTLTSLDITSLLSPTSTKEARLRRFPVPTEMDACCSHHCYAFSDTLNNYLCCLCCGLVWSLRWLPSVSFYSKAVGGNEALC